MRATNDLFVWYFEGNAGMGGWVLFLVLAVTAVSALIWDSQARRIRGAGWLLGAILVGCLIMPSVVFRFSSEETRNSLDAFKEWFFYLGLLSGVIPPIVAIGYFVTYAGYTGCEKGHIYEKSMGDCPKCSKQSAGQQGGQVWSAGAGAAAVRAEPAPQAPPPRANRVKIGYAWLVDESHNRRYDLFQGVTRIGRSAENDIVLADKAVSRKGHAQISESSGHFRLSDIGGKSSVLLNERSLGQPAILQNSDKITVGDTVLVFVTSR